MNKVLNPYQLKINAEKAKDLPQGEDNGQSLFHRTSESF